MGVYQSKQFDVQIKGDNSPPTRADTNSQKIIHQALMGSIEQVVQQRVITEMLTDFTTQFADYTDNYEAVDAGLIAFDHFLNQRMALIAGGSE